MDLARPHSAIVPSLEGEVLLVLARTTRPLTGREVARLCRTGSQAGINRTLARLSEQGVVTVQEAGRSLLYQLNRSHIAAPVVDLLANLREAFLDRIRSTLQEWAIPPRHASFFGSGARGEGDASSDVDLFLVRPSRTGEGNPAWRAQVDDLARRIQQWSGNHAGISEVSLPELGEMKKQKAPVLASLQRDGILLAGEGFGTLLKKV